MDKSCVCRCICTCAVTPHSSGGALCTKVCTSFDTKEEVVGSDLAEVKLFSYIKGYSTTQVLKKKGNEIQKYVFDIDGTICTQSAPDYANAQPFLGRIKKINNLYDEGNTITLYTARGMGRHNNNPLLAIQDFYEFTASQLKEWGVKYNKLMMHKPSYDLWIDDKCINVRDYIKDNDFE